ncbi:MAG: CHC2 zinc finger domain-containing protein, partial [Candidatus Methanoperedens sp.]|nr:CHC2 zinc finger domain-containing protein [Candidatus Methanoperedens sp.]
LVIERKEEAEETKSKLIIRKSQNTRGFVTQEQIQRARSYPISKILGKKKLVVCPFHNDAVPSLSIDHERGLWHCFGCSRSGNVIQLVMKLEGLDFRDAVRRLIDPG